MHVSTRKSKHSRDNSRNELPLVKGISIRSPKRRVPCGDSRENWFPYYAGYSSGFVEDVFSILDLPSDALVLDPWLGGGTTAEVSARRGIPVWGFDINHAMLVVARARTLSVRSTLAIEGMLDKIIERCRKSPVQSTGEEPDPLDQWLTRKAASSLRSIERAIVNVESVPVDLTSIAPIDVKSLSSVSAFFYLCLFRAFRHFIYPFQSSNPTWIKIPEKKNRLRISGDAMLQQFKTEAKQLIDSLASEGQAVRPSKVSIETAHSTCLPIRDSSVDAVVSSPPYCTRIDYVRATMPELAIIGHPTGGAIRHLRRSMLGTTTIESNQPSASKAWGVLCNAFLSEVANHPSKASVSYYEKYFRQYFSGTFASLVELNRVLKVHGHCVLVVQDSYYKDVHADLPGMFVEMGASIGWRLEDAIPFSVKRSFAGINPQVKSYRNDYGATETVLMFSKEARR